MIEIPLSLEQIMQNLIFPTLHPAPPNPPLADYLGRIQTHRGGRWDTLRLVYTNNILIVIHTILSAPDFLSNKRIQFLISAEFWRDIMSYFIIFIIPASTESHQTKLYIISYLVISMDSYYRGARPRSQEAEDTPGSARYSSTWPFRSAELQRKCRI